MYLIRSVQSVSSSLKPSSFANISNLIYFSKNVASVLLPVSGAPEMSISSCGLGPF